MGPQPVLPVLVEPGRVRPHVALRPGGVLVVKLGEDGRQALRDALEGWYRKRAKTEVAPRLAPPRPRARPRHKRLSIRGQRTRWASCSSSGAMSFNWRLLLAPEEV